MQRDELYRKIVELQPADIEEGLELYKNAPLGELMFIASELRQIHIPGRKAGWMIDRNINTTNICFSRCAFCNFCHRKDSPGAYVTTMDQYRQKIDELFRLGGDQILLQGGMNPALGLGFYCSLFRELKKLYPTLKLHALGPPEIVFLAKKEKISISRVLEDLIDSGLDSLPGAGAEILSDRVRKIISPAKASADEWLEVMRIAHSFNLPTSATMMYGHVETVRERIEHLVKLRELQQEKPENSRGFIAFIPWPFQDKGTRLRTESGVKSTYSPAEYLRMIAISRIMLTNIKNIQASVLTVGRETGMLSLHAGANDLGSVMIEENVVSSAGSDRLFSADDLREIIADAGFEPQRRNQKYEELK